MNSLIISFLAVATALIPGGVTAYPSSNADQLRQRLLYGYNKDVHPHNAVRLLYQVVYMECPIPDSNTGMLVSKIHETQRWADERLRWDPSVYQQTRALRMSPDEVWTPEVSLRVNNGRELSSAAVRLSLSSSGVLHQSRIIEVSSSCERTHDAWKCQLRFVPWKYAGPNFVMETPALTHGVSGRLCPSNVKVEEYSAYVEQVGGPNISHYEYVVDMLIQTQ